METATKTSSLFTSSLHIFLLFQNFFISLFSASCDILKARIFRNNAGFIYYRKLFLTFG